MTATFVVCQNVNLTCKLCVRCDCTRLSQNLTTLNFLTVDTTEESTDVITSLSLIEELVEHLNTSDCCALRLILETNDLSSVTNLDDTTLETAGSNCTTTCDCEYVLNRHQEREVCRTSRCSDELVYSLHELKDRSILRSVNICRCGLQSLQSGTTDDRCIVARELVLVEEVTDVHLNELEELFVVDLVALVHEYYDVRNAYLTSEQDVLTCLRHRTVRSRYYEDSTVHLSSTGDHVLDIVSVTGAVNVSIVTSVCLILNVSGVDRDTTGSLFRSLIDIAVSFILRLTLEGQNLRDSSCQRSLAVVNVTNGTDVNVRLSSFKFCLCHLNFLLVQQFC